jgi:hypothetical protein
VLQGCSDLQPTNYHNESTNNAYSTPSDIKAAVNGVYTRLAPFPGDSYEYYGAFQVTLTDYTTDMGFSTESAPNKMATISYNSNNKYFETGWTNMYQLISNANQVLQNIDNVHFESEKTKHQLIGQTRFLRALAYRDLTNAWGSVPLITEPISSPQNASSVKLSSEQKVDSLIIADCKYAIDNLPEEWNEGGKKTGRATKGSALTLLGLVYMRSHEYKKAKEYIDQVIDLWHQGVYTLNPSFKDVWAGTNKTNEGMIFGILRNSSAGAGAETKNHFGPTDSREVPGRWQFFGVSLYFWRKYDDNDPRKKFFYYNYVGDAPRGPNTNYGFYYKIPDPGQTKAKSDTVKLLKDVATKKYAYKSINNSYFDSRTIKIFRLSGVILLKAEIENALHGPADALPYVNKVRKRAGAPLYGQGNPDFSQPTSKEQMNNIILAERGFELVFEFHRRADLIRLGKYVEVANDFLKSMGLAPSLTKNQLYFPYPLVAAKNSSAMQEANNKRTPK